MNMCYMFTQNKVCGFSDFNLEGGRTRDVTFFLVADFLLAFRYPSIPIKVTLFTICL